MEMYDTNLMTIAKHMAHSAVTDQTPWLRGDNLMFLLATMNQMFSGISDLHTANILHKDIKLENIMISVVYGIVVICDLGVSRILLPGDESATFAGTPIYMTQAVIEV